MSEDIKNASETQAEQDQGSPQSRDPEQSQPEQPQQEGPSASPTAADAGTRNPDENQAAQAEAEEVANASPEQILEWKQQAAKTQESWERVLRLTADFENFKKRALRDRQEAIRYANESLLESLLPVLDNFEMALSASSAPGQQDAIRQGVQMIFGQLKNVMTDAGLEEIDARDKPFDPNLHEAVSEKETADIPEGHVAQQIRKGYKLRDRLVRPASVVVAKQPTA